MSAEFTMHQPPAGGGSTPSFPGGKKKGGVNKTYLYIGGAVIIMFYIVFIKRQQAASQPAAVDQSTTGYPSNSVDYQSAIQNQSDMMSGNLNAALNQFQAQMNSDYGTQLNQIAAKMDTMQGQLDGLNSHPNPVQTTPAPAPAPTPVTPAPAPAKNVYTESAGIKYAVPNAGWNAVSIVDYLKANGQKNDFASRQVIAQKMGIQNYRGTAEQNLDMLHRLKAGN